MTFFQNFRLTTLTIAFLALTLIFVVLAGDRIVRYFDLIYFVPGLFFSILVAITLKSEKPIFWKIGFVLISTILYSLIYIGSFMLSYIGVCTLPSLGALLFIGLINVLLVQQISNRTMLLSLLSGPISGGITLIIIFSFQNYNGLIFFLPIPIWWIFMAVLIDVSNQKKENV